MTLIHRRRFEIVGVTLILFLAFGAFGCQRQQQCPTTSCPPPPPAPTCPVCDCGQVAGLPGPAPTTTGPTTEEWMAVRTPILFRTGGSELDEEARQLLREMVNTVRMRDDIIRVRVEGHTDGRGADASNESLSLERAQSVAAYLVTLGVPDHMLETVGYGSERPTTSDHSALDREQNRRVEFSILVRRPVNATTP